MNKLEEIFKKHCCGNCCHILYKNNETGCMSKNGFDSCFASFEQDLSSTINEWAEVDKNKVEKAIRDYCIFIMNNINHYSSPQEVTFKICEQSLIKIKE